MTTGRASTTSPRSGGIPKPSGLDELRKEGAGLWRFVDGGKRYLVGEWPEEDFRAFDEEGTSTIYDEVPESEAPPDYEPLAAEVAESTTTT